MAEGGAGDVAAIGAEGAMLKVTVVACLAPRKTREWTLELPQGAVVADALRASGAMPTLALVRSAETADQPLVGVWGRVVSLDAPLQHLDRVEIYRPLKVDPKVARRERFVRQGARTTGLFARRRPGGKAGY